MGVTLRATEGYRFVRPVVLTDADIDRQAHLNNAAVARILNDLRVAYIAHGPGMGWRDYLAAERLTVVVRELHISYDREATIDDELVGCVRVVARRGKAKILEQRLVDAARDLVVAKAWVVQLVVRSGTVIEFPEFYWDAVAAVEGRVIPPEPRGPSTGWGPPAA